MTVPFKLKDIYKKIMGSAFCCATDAYKQNQFEDYSKLAPIRRAFDSSDISREILKPFNNSETSSPSITLKGHNPRFESNEQIVNSRLMLWNKDSPLPQSPLLRDVSVVEFEDSNLGRISSENINQFYDIGKEIGSGRYGIVRLALKHSHPKKRFAIKTIPKDIAKEEMKLLESELDILRSTDHPNIINFYEIYQDESMFYIVTEFFEGGELLEYIQSKERLSE